MKKLPLILTAIATTQIASAANILLSTDTVSNGPGFNSSFSGTLNDGFAYNENDPTSATPELNLTLTGEATANGFHASAANVEMNYTLSGGAYTASALELIVFDIWGRDSSPGNETRDDDFDVTLYNGDYSTVVATMIDQGIAPQASNPELHERVAFTGFTGTFDRIRITGKDAAFAVQEIRLASVAAPVPEPSSTALLGLGALGLVLRRRR